MNRVWDLLIGSEESRGLEVRRKAEAEARRIYDVTIIGSVMYIKVGAERLPLAWFRPDKTPLEIVTALREDYVGRALDGVI